MTVMKEVVSTTVVVVMLSWGISLPYSPTLAEVGGWSVTPLAEMVYVTTSGVVSGASFERVNVRTSGSADVWPPGGGEALLGAAWVGGAEPVGRGGLWSKELIVTVTGAGSTGDTVGGVRGEEG